MFCVQCGNQLPDDAKFCLECGAALTAVGANTKSEQLTAQANNAKNSRKVSARRVGANSRSDQQAMQTHQAHDSGHVDSLLGYLQNVLHCEATLLGLESTLQQNRETAATLGKMRSLPSGPEKPVMQEDDVMHGKGTIVAAIFSFGLFVLFLALGSTVLAVITAIMAVYNTFGIFRVMQKRETQKQEKAQEYRRQIFEYEDDMDHHRARVAEDNARIKRETEEKRIIMAQSLDVEDLISHTKETLSQLYGMPVLHEKYQNFVAVASIHDCLSTGRTTTLVREGDDPGAYNIYEEDVRIGKVMSIVGMVGTQIIGAINEMADAVRYQQQALYDAVCEGNELQRALASDVSAQMGSLKEGQERSNILQEEMLRQEKLKTDAMREYDHSLNRSVLRNLSGHIVD